MKKDELNQAISTLRDFIENKSNQSIEDTIEWLENELRYIDIEWENTLQDIALVISHYQPLANSYNCKLKYSIFTIADVRYLDVHLNKNGYKCTLLETSEYSKSNISIKLENILDDKLIETASEIDRLVN